MERMGSRGTLQLDNVPFQPQGSSLRRLKCPSRQAKRAHQDGKCKRLHGIKRSEFSIMEKWHRAMFMGVLDLTTLNAAMKAQAEGTSNHTRCCSSKTIHEQYFSDMVCFTMLGVTHAAGLQSARWPGSPRAPKASTKQIRQATSAPIQL